GPGQDPEPPLVPGPAALAFGARLERTDPVRITKIPKTRITAKLFFIIFFYLLKEEHVVNLLVRFLLFLRCRVLQKFRQNAEIREVFSGK
ncbi:MAG: hypothetical protein WBC42_02945, partial [Candidatus Zixiibacteriota bacterium]